MSGQALIPMFDISILQQNVLINSTEICPLNFRVSIHKTSSCIIDSLLLSHGEMFYPSHVENQSGSFFKHSCACSEQEESAHI